MQVWRLKIDTMGGSGDYHPIAFRDERVAKAVAEAKKEEWTSFIPERIEARQVAPDEVAVGRELYTLDSQTWEEYLKIQALKKLTPEERKVLKLTERKVLKLTGKA